MFLIWWRLLSLSGSEASRCFNLSVESLYGETMHSVRFLSCQIRCLPGNCSGTAREVLGQLLRTSLLILLQWSWIWMAIQLSKRNWKRWILSNCKMTLIDTTPFHFLLQRGQRNEFLKLSYVILKWEIQISRILWEYPLGLSNGLGKIESISRILIFLRILNSHEKLINDFTLLVNRSGTPLKKKKKNQARLEGVSETSQT